MGREIQARMSRDHQEQMGFQVAVLDSKVYGIKSHSKVGLI